MGKYENEWPLNSISSCGSYVVELVTNMLSQEVLCSLNGWLAYLFVIESFFECQTGYFTVECVANEIILNYSSIEYGQEDPHIAASKLKFMVFDFSLG